MSYFAADVSCVLHPSDGGSARLPPPLLLFVCLVVFHTKVRHEELKREHEERSGGDRAAK